MPFVTSIINQAKQRYPAGFVDSKSNAIDIRAALIDVLHSERWTTEQIDFFQAWLKKMDVSQKHYQLFDQQWKPVIGSGTINDGTRQLTVALTFGWLNQIEHAGGAEALTLKIINVLYKMLAQVSDVFGTPITTLTDDLQQRLVSHQPQRLAVTPPISHEVKINQTLPITLLFSEGPIARAYLEAIAAMGLKVAKIIKLVSKVDLVSKQPVGRLLPQSLKVQYAAHKQYKQMFYWPHQYQKKYIQAIDVIQKQLQSQLGFKLSNLQAATEHKDLRRYTDEVEALLINGLNDPLLSDHLKQSHEQLFLYTGGGIVPAKLLEINQLKMIHIHPGFLPDIKGADCVLWSQLLHQRMSATAFYLAAGIDDGDVLLPCWLPQIELKSPKKMSSRVKYRLIYGYLDPWVRAFVLQQLIRDSNGLSELIAKPQDKQSGMIYHFMHEELKQQAYKRFECIHLEHQDSPS